MENNNAVTKNEFGFYRLNDIPSQEELDEYYQKKYFQEDRAIYFHEYSPEELLYFRNKNEQKAIIIERLFSSKNEKPRLLDVGCGEGFTLAYFHERGWDVRGVDYSEYGCKQHNPEMLPFFSAGDIYKQLDSLLQTQTKYDCIWLDNVLEHVIDPGGLLQKLTVLAHSGTILMIEVPNDFSVIQNKLLADGKIDRPFWVVSPDHLSYFNLEGLTNLAESCGWENKHTIADFPIDFNLANPFANYVMNRDVGKGAHQQRIFVENIMHSVSPDLTNLYYAAMAQLGLGRQLISFLTLKNSDDERN